MKFLSTTLFLFITPAVNGIPMTHRIDKHEKECLYAPLRSGEFITTSLFITKGDELKGKVIIQGPIAPKEKIMSSAEVLAASMRTDKNVKSLSLNFAENYDFGATELLEDDMPPGMDDWMMDDYYDNTDDMDDVTFADYYYTDDDDEYEFMEDDGMDDQERTEIRKAKAERDGMSAADVEKMKAERREEKMKKLEEAKSKRKAAKARALEMMDAKKKKLAAHKERMEEMNKNDGMRGVMEGKMFEKTLDIVDEGWYRYCVEATHGSIGFEMELRQETELGKPNTHTGHIQSYERHDTIQREKKLLGKLSAQGLEADGIKEEDLETTKKQIQKMTLLINEIKEKQTNERHRLSIHKAVNEHSHSRMVLNSLFETVFYIAVSGFQVYTIRKWFSGSPILGY